MTIIQRYKKKMIETIETIYNGKIDHDWIVNYVNQITKEAENTKLLAHCRNLYKYQFHFTRDPNFIPNEIEDKHLNILANGLYTENFNPAVFKILNEWMDERSKYKKKMLACKNAGDMDGYREYNAKQNKKKANTNAIYGASTMPKGWISNIDMGGAITAQARNFISEQVWCIERFLGSNYAFYNINEIFAFITKLFEIKKKIFTPEVLSLLDYIPTPDDCRKRFIQITMDVPRLRKDLKDMQQSVFLMFEMMEDWKRVAFYYANNPLELIAKNQKMFNNMKTFIDMDVEFINPYEIPEEMNAPMKEFFYYMQTFCYASIIVSERVLKYQTKFRKVCVIGDTDSTMPSFSKVTSDIFRIFGYNPETVDEKTRIRIIMIIVSLTTDLLDKCCENYVNCTNSDHPENQFYMKMKNEFFFPIVVLFPGKKNYIGLQTIQEGKMIPESMQLAITGAALGASSLNEYVISHILELIENVVLRSKQYNPLEMVRGVNAIKDHIRDAVLSGDKTFGIYKRFSGLNTLKDPEKMSVARAACIWNDLYPDDFIAPGDAVYLFDTDLITEEDLERMPAGNDEIKERIRTVVYRSRGSLDYAHFGLKSFAIPANGDHTRLPDWVIPYINVTSIVEKHVKPITTLYPSLLLSSSTYRVNGTKKQGTSTLVRC